MTVPFFAAHLLIVNYPTERQVTPWFREQAALESKLKGAGRTQQEEEGEAEGRERQPKATCLHNHESKQGGQEIFMADQRVFKSCI